jgi:hypothetical protein
MLTMSPVLRLTMPGSRLCVIRIRPTRLVCTMSAQSSAEPTSKRLRPPTSCPALFTSTSIAWNSAGRRSGNRATAAASVTSSASANDSPPSLADSAASAASSRSTSTTLAPCAMSAAQIAVPIPPAAPVTSAVRPIYFFQIGGATASSGG